MKRVTFIYSFIFAYCFFFTYTSIYAEDSLSYHTIPHINYFHFVDILNSELSVFPIFTGIAGNGSSISYLGGQSADNALFINGVATDNVYGLSNFDGYSPEFTKSVSLFSGSEAAIIYGKSGIVMDVEPPHYNSAKPYTRLWLGQGDSKLFGTDFTFTQNFAERWNITAGYKRLSANSSYPNSFFDSWNARAMLRYKLSEKSGVSLLYHFVNYYTGDFGGILFSDNSNAAANTTGSNFSDLQNRQYRTDVILNYQYNDSSFLLNSNMFFNHNENNIFFAKQKELLELDSTGKSIGTQINYGINTRGKYSVNNWLYLIFGGELSYCNLDETLLNESFTGIQFNSFFLAKFSLFSCGVRYEKKYSENLLSYGARIELLNLGKKFLMYCDFSHYNSQPLPIYNYEYERGTLGIVTAKYDKIELNIFDRYIENPLLLQFDENIYSFTLQKANFENKNLFGCSISVEERISIVDTKIGLQTIYDTKEENIKGLLTAKIYYTYYKNINYIGGGVSATLLLNADDYYYNPLFKSYSQVDINNENKLNYDGISIFVSGKFGNCFINASFNNIIGNNYKYMQYYLMPKQELRLSLTWAFPIE